jgi:hypothetical protein
MVIVAFNPSGLTAPLKDARLGGAGRSSAATEPLKLIPLKVTKRAAVTAMLRMAP